MNVRTSSALLVCLCLAAGNGAPAQEPTDARPDYPLGLGEALGMALQNNLDLVFARKDPEIALQNVIIEDAAFDRAFEARVLHSEQKQESTRADIASNAKFDEASAGVVQPFRFGGQVAADVTLSRSDLGAQSGFFSANEVYSSDLTINLDLPLLRGFGSESVTAQWIISRGNLQITQEDFRSQAQTTLETIERTYWDLVAARRALVVERQSLARAHDLLGLNRKKVEVGTLAPIEITQAEAGVASQEEGVILAETTVENVEDELRRLLAVPQEHPLWTSRIVPTDEPVLTDVELDLEAAIEQAFTQRPEIQRAELLQRTQRLQERVARNAVRHDLSLRASVVPSGTDVPEVDPGPDGFPGTTDDEVTSNPDIADAIQEMAKFDFYTWSAQVVYRLPFGNRAAKATYARARLQSEKADVGLQNALANVRVEVRQAVREVDSGRKRVEAARSNVLLQQKKLEAEQKKFENGMSTSFEVLTFQNDLAEAQLSEIRALTDFNKALLALDLATGNLLAARGLTLETVQPAPLGPFRPVREDPFEPLFAPGDERLGQ